MIRTTTAVFIAALALIVAACGGSDGGGSGSRSPSGKATGEINVWAWGNEGEILGELTKQFEAENPGVKVNVTSIPVDAAHDKILTSVAGNQAPDVAMVGTTWMGELARTQTLDEAPSSIDQSQFFKGVADTVKVDGKTYGVPWYVETRLLYYRTDIAEKAGITEAPKTWDELKATARAMQDKGGAKYGINLSTNNWQEYLPFVWQAGGDLAQGRRVHAQLAAGRRGHRLLQVLRRRGPEPQHDQAGLRHHARVRARHAPDVLLRPVAHGPGQRGRRRGLRQEVGGRADADQADQHVASSAAPTGRSSSRPRTATRRGSSSSGRPSPRRRRSGTRSRATCPPTRPRGTFRRWPRTRT